MIYGASLTALLAAADPAFAQHEAPALQDVVIVTGHHEYDENEIGVSPDYMPTEGADITRLIARTPGAARIGNGELSGQVQYRGMFGERLNLRVDGQHFGSGGPNLMDPAFHYAPAPLVRRIVIDRGVSPVSEGPGLGGGADAVFKRVDYSGDAAPTLAYDLSAGYRTADSSYSYGGVAGLSTDSWRLNLLGSYEDGDDLEYGDGTIGGTSYTRAVLGASGGVRFGAHEVSADIRRHEAGPAGNPPFPMDIRYMDTDFAKARYLGEFDLFTLEANVGWVSVAHAMNNFDLRPAPASPMMWRETPAYADTTTGDVSASFNQWGGRLELGLDAYRAEHSATITNPNNSNFFVAAIPDAEVERFGMFAEWRGAVGSLNSELGLRVDRHTSDVGEASVGSALPPAPGMLAMAYNGVDRSFEDTGVDAVARFFTDERDGFVWRFTLAHKTHAPTYLQRYGWMPIPASGGLADGNTYVGNLDLELERALIAEVGFDYFGDRFYARPTVYTRQVSNFVQGGPFDSTPGVIDTPQEMISNMNGDPTPLRWANVDAEFYGLDVDFGYDFEGPLRFDGVLNYVRGKRGDVDDNLYRIAPPNLTGALTWQEDMWSASMEVRAVAEQDEVSATNSEQPTPGYVTLGLFADWHMTQSVHVSVGVENLFDHVYRDHLSGYNRNSGSDVAVGTRLPGAGRSAFFRIGIVG